MMTAQSARAIPPGLRVWRRSARVPTFADNSIRIPAERRAAAPRARARNRGHDPASTGIPPTAKSPIAAEGNHGAVFPRSMPHIAIFDFRSRFGPATVSPGPQSPHGAQRLVQARATQMSHNAGRHQPAASSDEPLSTLRRAVVEFARSASTEISTHDARLLGELALRLPAGMTVYVAHTPKASLEDVVRVALQAQAAGFTASPPRRRGFAGGNSRRCRRRTARRI